MKLFLSVFHDQELFFLKNFHSAYLKGPGDKHTEQWLNFVVKVKKLVVPYLRFTK